MCTTESSNRCTSPATYTVAGLLHSHLHTPHLHGPGWLAARQLHQVLFQTHKTLVQCDPTVPQSSSTDEFHHPVGCPWPEIRLDITGVASRESFTLADLRLCFVAGLPSPDPTPLVGHVTGGHETT